MAWNITGNIGRGGGSYSSISNRFVVKPALAISQRIILIVAKINPALFIRQRIALIFPVKPSLVVTQRAAGTPMVKVNPALVISQRIIVAITSKLKPALLIRLISFLRFPVNPSLVITQRAQGTMLSKVFPALMTRDRVSLRPGVTAEAVNLMSITYNLTQIKGASAQTTAGTAWTNPTNVIGRKNSTNATRASSATAATDGTMTLDFVDSVSKTDLIISSVNIRFFVSHTSVLGLSTMRLGYKINAGAQVQLQQDTATIDVLANGVNFDITSIIAGSWTTLDSLQAYVQWLSPLGTATDSHSLDAIEVTVVAAKTDTI